MTRLCCPTVSSVRRMFGVHSRVHLLAELGWELKEPLLIHLKEWVFTCSFVTAINIGVIHITDITHLHSLSVFGNADISQPIHP